MNVEAPVAISAFTYLSTPSAVRVASPLGSDFVEDQFPTSKQPAFDPAEATDRSLVIFIFAWTDSEDAYDNLDFFLRNGVLRDSTRFNFLLVLIGNSSQAQREIEIPALSNLDVVKLAEGLEPCAITHAIEFVLEKAGLSLLDLPKLFRYIIHINSTLRGPFLPRYFQGEWPEMFISLLSEDVWLCGSFISCERTPHVQSMIRAMNSSVFLRYADSAFRCTLEKSEAITNFEVGLSSSVIADGGNIASLLLAYSGVDFRLLDNRKCNNNKNPYLWNWYYSVYVSPLESVFVKIAGSFGKQGLAEPAKQAMELYQMFLARPNTSFAIH